MKSAIENNLSIVIQGPVSCSMGSFGEFLNRLQHWRSLYPQTEIILSISQFFLPDSTGNHVDLTHTKNQFLDHAKRICDHVVIADYQDGLPPLKFNSRENNCNRMIAAAQAGLAVASRDFVLRTRSDSFFFNLGALVDDVISFHVMDKIVVSPFYTINPLLREKLSFHFSDWFHFGRTDAVRALWNVPYLSYADATYFEHHDHHALASNEERAFRARFSPEQWITMHYARKKGFKTPEFAYEKGYEKQTLEFLRQEFFIADIDKIGFHFPKYMDGFKRYKTYKLHCVSQDDWIALHQRGIDAFIAENKARILAANGLDRIFCVKIRSLKLKLLIANIVTRIT